MHSLRKNEDIPMWGKHRSRITKEIAIHLTRIITSTFYYYHMEPLLFVNNNLVRSVMMMMMMKLY